MRGLHSQSAAGQAAGGRAPGLTLKPCCLAISQPWSAIFLRSMLLAPRFTPVSGARGGGGRTGGVGGARENRAAARRSMAGLDVAHQWAGRAHAGRHSGIMQARWPAARRLRAGRRRLTVAGDEHAGLAVLDAGGQGVRGEAAKHHRVHGADAGARKLRAGGPGAAGSSCCAAAARTVGA